MRAIKQLFFIICLGIFGNSYAQNLSQNIHGSVLDKNNQMGLPGASIIVTNGNFRDGVITDNDGFYKIKEVPVGRVNIEISFMGYNTAYFNNIELSSAKELIIHAQLEENVESLDEIVLTAKEDKTRTQNEMITVSARTFSIEESQRFAGARNDVSRMAANYAGIQSSNDAVNDIVIRGNSPNGLLWRLEGIDIPNPNHFGEGGATGGPVSILNNNVLSNSDFLTSAFPAEYGNALSGVFDLSMRSGNTEKHEFIGQMGLNGLEFGAEGPISKENKSSYLINYRYSTLGIMQDMGIDFGTGTAVPAYQDITFKLQIPTKKFGKFEIFGLGGKSDIAFKDSEKDEDDEDLYDDGTLKDVTAKSHMAVVGLSNKYLINSSTYSKITFALTTINNNNIVDSVSHITKEPFDFYKGDLTRTTFTTSVYLHKKLSKKNSLRLGAFVKDMHFDMVDSVYETHLDRFRTTTDYNGSTQLYQPYVQWVYRPSNRLTFNTGVHAQYLSLNESSSIEPRFGMRYSLDENQSISAGYGLHSMLPPINLYFSQVRLANGDHITPNTQLDFVKSNHFILGYDRSLGDKMRFKAELYYQQISDAIVEQTPSSFSLLNQTSFGDLPPDYLKNGGKGTNYGLELTLEKFMDKGLYFLITTSLFDSKYQGSDGIEYSTAFDSKYVFNALVGKEFILPNKKENTKLKQRLISIDAKVTSAGGKRYSPALIQESIDKGEIVRDETRAFTEQFSNYFRADLRIAYKISNSKISQEWALDIQNISNHENPLNQILDLNKSEIKTINQLGIFPILQYRIIF